MDEAQKYKLAHKKVEAKIGFYIHAGVFIAVNLLLIIINLTANPENKWFVYPLVGWGMGLMLHYFLAFSSVSTSDWKKKMIEKEMDSLK